MIVKEPKKEDSMKNNPKPTHLFFYTPGRKTLIVITIFFASLLLPSLAYACRAHLDRWGGQRLEKKGEYEEAAYYHRVGMDFYACMFQLWKGNVYDERVDEIYRQYNRIFGPGWDGVYCGELGREDRWDDLVSYWFFFMREGAARNVDKGKLSAAQRTRTEDRLRIYNEDIMDPYNGLGCDMNFIQKAWVLEQTGLFWHASFRRELAGRFMIRVCSQYCAAVADEMELVFNNPTQAKLYRQKALWWRSRAMDELHRCNGNRALARLKGNKQKRLPHEEVLTILKKGLHDSNIDARRTAVLLLSDFGELEVLEQAMKDKEVEIRKAAATTFAKKMYLPGLALAFQDKADEVSTIARAVLHVKAESAGPYVRAVCCLAQGLENDLKSSDFSYAFAIAQLKRLSGLTVDEEGGSRRLSGREEQPTSPGYTRSKQITEGSKGSVPPHFPEWHNWVQKTTGGVRPGALFEYFEGSDKTRPITSKVLENVDIGIVEMPQFPKAWYEYLDKPTVIPPNANGPFRLLIKAKLYIPVDGNYRFYVKTHPLYRAKIYIETHQDRKKEIISPQNDKNLQYAKHGGEHRIDVSSPIALKKGLRELVIDYRGDNIRKIFNKWNKELEKYPVTRHVGIQLFWSSDHHPTELVPAANLFH